MRVILPALLWLITFTGAQAAESLPLNKHTVACQSAQDILDLNGADRPGQAAPSQSLSPWDLATRYFEGTCQEYTAGTLVYTDKETTLQGSDLVCIKTNVKDACLWALK